MEAEAKETKEQAFVRLAQKRVNRALRDIKLIGNLGTYPHTDGQTEKIVGSLKAAVVDMATRFSKVKGEKKESTEFEL